jgi:hypothetical protein
VNQSDLNGEFWAKPRNQESDWRWHCDSEWLTLSHWLSVHPVHRLATETPESWNRVDSWRRLDVAKFIWTNMKQVCTKSLILISQYTYIHLNMVPRCYVTRIVSHNNSGSNLETNSNKTLTNSFSAMNLRNLSRCNILWHHSHHCHGSDGTTLSRQQSVNLWLKQWALSRNRWTTALPCGPCLMSLLTTLPLIRHWMALI